MSCLTTPEPAPEESQPGMSIRIATVVRCAQPVVTVAPDLGRRAVCH